MPGEWHEQLTYHTDCHIINLVIILSAITKLRHQGLTHLAHNKKAQEVKEIPIHL
jgi:hypothetical protein